MKGEGGAGEELLPLILLGPAAAAAAIICCAICAMSVPLVPAPAPPAPFADTPASICATAAICDVNMYLEKGGGSWEGWLDGG